MHEVFSEQVSVICVYNRAGGNVMPVKMKWQGREYRITKLGYYHRKKEGRTLLHVFSVSSESMFFKLVLNSETLAWKLEEVSDGLVT